MKKMFLMATVACLAFASCEDVPEPYEIFDINNAGSGSSAAVIVAEGDGTAANPYNVKAISTIDPGTGVTTTTIYYVKGIVSQLKEFGSSYGNYSYYISDDGSTTNQYYIYRGLGLDSVKFTAATDLNVGDSVIVSGKIVNYNGTLEFAQGNKLVSLNGKTASTSGGSTSGGGTTGGTGTTGTSMTLASVLDGTPTLGTNAYGTQAAATESTWATWKFNGINYKGARICQAKTIANTIQIQGNDSDEAKQGFIFNADPFATDIKTITLVLKVTHSDSAFDPGYNLYAGAAAHPSKKDGEAIAPKDAKTYTLDGDVRVYTQEFDLSSKSYKYFTISNDKTGVLYLDQVTVTLK